MKFTADDLQFQDDEEAEFGSDGDFGMSYSSGNDRLEIADKINSASSYVPRGRSGSLVKGRFGQTVAKGKVLADDGNVYDSVQAAVNNASSWVRIGEGRFNESVSINSAGLTLEGSGYKTIISSNSGRAVNIDSADVTVKNLSVSTGLVGSSNDGILTDARSLVENVRVKEADRDGILVGGDGCIIKGCVIDSSTRDGILINGFRGIVLNCRASSTGRHGILTQSSDDSVVSNNIIENTSESGIFIAQDDSICGGNRVSSAGTYGIRVGSISDSIIFNNRVSGSKTDDFYVTGTNITLDGNLPPAP